MSKYFAYDENNKRIEFLSEEKDGIIKLTLPLPEFKDAKNLVILPELGEVKVGEKGF